MDNILNSLNSYITQPNWTRTIIVVALAMVVAFWLSERLARLIIKVAQLTAGYADKTTNEERQLQLRRIETYLSVAVAVVRFIVVVGVAYIAYRLVSGETNQSAAAIGASAIFVVLANGTVGSLLRDITSGASMIVERWFNVGDHIRVEPFADVGGVVERATLRSTKIRSLNGEIIWLHNQHIQGVKVTPRGLRTVAVDIFMSSPTAGRKLVERAIQTIPTGPLMLARPLLITRDEAWSNELQHIEVQGQTPPGREWLIEDFFVESLKQLDGRRKTSILVRPPLVRNADPEADRNFKRAVRVAKREQAKS